METLQFTPSANVEQKILCCACGTAIPPNPANMCVDCIRNEVDITEGIPKQAILTWCKNCERYLQPPNHWVTCQLESRELLTVCLKKLRGLSKVRLIDAGFIWTEPHSRRIKVKLVIQKEVFTSTILQHSFVVEFVIQNQQCESCQRRMANDNWKAIVQVRQRVDHKKTFYYLEQLILKHHAHANTINIKERPDGLDFYYAAKNEAMKMVDFLSAVAPVRYKASERLISTDVHSNTSNYKFTFSVELIPICKNDFVCLPKKLAKSLGNIAQLVVVHRVGNSLHVVDPQTLRSAEINLDAYWRFPFRALCAQKQLIEYTLLDIEPLGVQNGKFALAEFTAARTRDLGANDTVFYGRTHLGNILKPGDTCLGFDVGFANTNDENANEITADQLPDVILIKKSYPERKKNKNRHWRLKSLEKDAEGISKRDEEKAMEDYENFLEDLEEDRELRSGINIYRDTSVDVQQLQQEQLVRNQQLLEAGVNPAEEPGIGLEELLEEMTIHDEEPDAEDAQYALARAALEEQQAALLAAQQQQEALAQQQQLALANNVSLQMGLPMDHPSVQEQAAILWQQHQEQLVMEQQQQMLLLQQQQ